MFVLCRTIRLMLFLRPECAPLREPWQPGNRGLILMQGRYTRIMGLRIDQACVTVKSRIRSVFVSNRNPNIDYCFPLFSGDDLQVK